LRKFPLIPVLFATLKSTPSKSKLPLGIKRSILKIIDQFWHAVFRRLNLDEKVKIFAENIHFVKKYIYITICAFPSVT
jgi:hypothetical protein